MVRPAMVYGARDMCSDEKAKEEVGCGGNEDGEMDVWTLESQSWKKKNYERITGTTKVGKISKCRKVTEKTVLVGR